MATTTSTTTEIETSPDSTGVGLQQSIDSQPAILQPLEIIEPATEDQDADIVYPTGVKFWSITLSLPLVLILVGMDANILATAVPTITDHFHTVADVGWYDAAYWLCACAFQFAFGKLYKLFSVKRVFLSSVAIFLVGSVIVATSTTSPMFIVGRAVTGTAAAGTNAGAFNIIAQIMPLRKRPMFISLLGSVEGVAIIAAPIIGGALTQHLSWRWCFYINLPIGGSAMVVIALLFSNPRDSVGEGLSWKEKLNQLDLIGNFFFIPSITSLFIILSWAGIKYPWSDPRIIGLFVVFGVLLVAFIYTQYRRGENAALPPRIFKQRSVLAGFIFLTCMSGSMSVVVYYMPTYFQAVRGYKPGPSGYLLLPALLSFLVAVLINGAGTSLMGYYTPFMIFASALTPIAAGLLTTFKVDTSIVRTLIYTGLTGFAAGIAYQAPSNAVQTVLPPADVPLGLSMILFGQYFGGALFVALAQTIFANQLAKNLHSLDPALTAKIVENMGIMELENTVGSHGKMDLVLSGIDKSLTEMWYLVVGLTCVTMIGSLTMEWKSVKEKRN